MKIKDFVRGDGPEIEPGYRRGDSWVQTVGDHIQCGKKIEVLGPGLYRSPKGRHEGVLVRCQGCLFSWVLR